MKSAWYEQPCNTTVFHFSFSPADELVSIEDPPYVEIERSQSLMLRLIVRTQAMNELPKSMRMQVDSVGTKAMNWCLHGPVPKVIVDRFPGQMPKRFMVSAWGMSTVTIRIMRPMPDHNVTTARKQGLLAVRTGGNLTGLPILYPLPLGVVEQCSLLNPFHCRLRSSESLHGDCNNLQPLRVILRCFG